MSKGEGDIFQEATKYQREKMSGHGLDWASKPDVHKEYPGAPTIDLSSRTKIETSSLDEALLKRKSVRHFSHDAMSTDQLSYLLWASCGLQRTERGMEFRTAPSAGALYPIETYVVVNRVLGVSPGVYHYSVPRHCLEVLREGDFSSETAIAALGQRMCLEAAAVIVWTAVFQRSKWKYGQRAYRYIYLDAGHIGGNLALAATAIGLGSCQVGALFDDEVNSIIGVDGHEESVVYMSVIGRPHLG
jgi:SagB-type dehydrogenase family enzyme